MRGRPSSIGIVLLLAACDSGTTLSAPRTPLAMPTMIDVIPSNTSDRSCACELRRQCVMVADAIAGEFEGRNLQCRVENEAGRVVRCRFEARFVEGYPPNERSPGPWRWEESVYHNYAPGAWCAGDG